MPALQISSANWMAGIPDRTRLFDLYIPGSHDAATGYFDRRDYSSNINVQPAQGVMTQDKRASYQAQLENGIRYLDLRFRKEGNSMSYYQLYHTYFLQTNLGEAVDAVRNFLQRNPTEVVFISLQPDDGSVVRPEDVRDDIFRYSKTNSSLSRYEGLGISYQASPDNLWIEGYKDFDTIRLLRAHRGLGNLGPKFNLTTGGYSDSLTIGDPKAKSGSASNPKLDYSGLALGDVRGKIVLVESLFSGYSGNGWDQPGTAVDPLDVQGIYSTGTVEQNNYAAPYYSDKKTDILDFAKRKEYTKFANDGSNRSLPLNYTSAGPTKGSYLPARMPASYAVTMNAGSINDSNNYTTDGTGTIAHWLNRKQLDPAAADGPLAQYNLSSKLNNSDSGLKGVMLGDYYTTSYAWYSEFWNAPWYKFYARDGALPNVNSDDYPVSDWLTQKIWRQSAIVTPTLYTVKNKDPLTGLVSVKEGESFELSWNDYLGVEKTGETNSSFKINDGTSSWTLQYKVTQVNGVNELGLAESDSRSLGLSSSTIFAKTARSKRLFNGVGSQVQKGFDFDQNQKAFVETFSIAPNSGVQGDRFFRIDLMASLQGDQWNSVGTPIYFMVTDG